MCGRKTGISGKGSKIIVTTRTNTSISSNMTRTPPHELKGLDEVDSLFLFFKCAFGDENLVERYFLALKYWKRNCEMMWRSSFGIDDFGRAYFTQRLELNG